MGLFGEEPQLFRKSALEKLSTPERLDTLMTVTRPKGWIALFAFLGILSVAVAWGFLGRMPQTISGRGIVLTAGGLRAVQAHGAGVVLDVEVAMGDSVAVDQVVAHIGQEELLEELENAERAVADHTEHRASSARYADENASASAASMDAQRRQIEETTRAAEERLEYLQGRVRQQEEAHRLGLITGEVLQNTVQEMAAARARLEGNRAELQSLSAREQSEMSGRAERLFDLDRQVRQAEERLRSARMRIEATSEVVSLYGGDVVEVVSNRGALVNQGSPIALVAPADQPLRSYLFISHGGSGIRPGMEVQIELDAAKWEDWGYMKAKVLSVTPQPVSREAMMALLHNDILVTEYSQAGNPRMVEIELERDSATVSGFAWTSRGGPPLEVHSGMRLTAKVVTKSERPIQLIIPALRRWFGV